ASETASIRAWLAHIGETDAGTIADVLQRCRNDAEARSYFIGRAAAELTEPEPDDRRHCRTCQHLSGSRCWATRLLVMDDLPRRCSDYLPMPDDSDQRNGRERWPWLIQKGANDGDH
ncbi:MAG TPA: hypothetical protein PKL28_07110, partial [Rhodocyclaceae bacterium]|nr:hypothetical protein [Rhodocyclaceae bacterium]